MEENEEEVGWRTEGETQLEEDGGDLDPEQVRQALWMFEFASWHEVTLKAGKAATTTKWIDRVKKDDDGREFVRCRPAARDFKPRREGPRDDLFKSIVCIRGAREETRTGP